MERVPANTQLTIYGSFSIDSNKHENSINRSNRSYRKQNT